ncbi:MAG: stage V sporulation protein T [Clostridiales bacterium]|nr:stage V sporulation protein T [Clostridiales bacterium]
MKATGIVRRIDDLGRVVIPKEIRRTLRIREGDPLEIFTDRDGEVILKKYSPISELNEFATEYAESVYDTLGNMTVITDTDQVIAVAGGAKKNLLDKRISKEIEKMMLSKTAQIIKEKEKVVPITSESMDDFSVESQVIVPIISQGDTIGSIVFISKENGKVFGDTELKVAETGASFLAKQMEQ